jgi:hypothetical protein
MYRNIPNGNCLRKKILQLRCYAHVHIVYLHIRVLIWGLHVCIVKKMRTNDTKPTYMDGTILYYRSLCDKRLLATAKTKTTTSRVCTFFSKFIIVISFW